MKLAHFLNRLLFYLLLETVLKEGMEFFQILRGILPELFQLFLGVSDERDDAESK